MHIKKCNLVCIAPDGEHVTDQHEKPYNECVYASQEMGSKWYFYPFHVITTPSNKTVVDIPYEGMEHFIGRRLSTVKKAIATGDYSYILEG